MKVVYWEEPIAMAREEKFGGNDGVDRRQLPSCLLIDTRIQQIEIGNDGSANGEDAFPSRYSRRRTDVWFAVVRRSNRPSSDDLPSSMVIELLIEILAKINTGCREGTDRERFPAAA